MTGLSSRLALGLACAALAATSAAMNGADGAPGATDWPSTNYDRERQPLQPARLRSPPRNVAHAAAGRGAFISSPPATPGRLREDEAIPLVIGNTMYLASPYGAIHRARRHDRRGEMEIPASQQRHAVEARPRLLAGRRRTCRSRRRSSSDGRPGGLYSLKASNGTLNDGFGENGVVNLKTPEVMQTGMDVAYSLLSSPTIYKNLIITGAGTGEGPGGSNGGAGPAGDTRAWDAQDRQAGVDVPHRAAARRVRLRHLGRRTARRTAPASTSGATRRSMRSAAFSTCRSARPNNDRVGIDRPGNNLFSSSVVAVDANTGKYLWHFQLVHHDIWDYDTQSAPLLVDLRRERHRPFPPSSSSTRPD